MIVLFEKGISKVVLLLFYTSPVVLNINATFNYCYEFSVLLYYVFVVSCTLSPIIQPKV